MANFDVNLMFFGTSPYQSASNFTSLVGVTGGTAITSSVINLSVAEDLGVGNGEAQPKIYVSVGTGITSAAAGLLINAQFQGSTDSSNWTTYAESGNLTTASFAAGGFVLPIDVPRRPSGAALPQYYRMNITTSGTANTISAGSLLGGIVLARPDSADTLAAYPANFTVGA